MSVLIETTIGDITVDLFHEIRPRTSLNFLKLCKMKYYNLNLIYSLERNFLAQMGDPSGTGRGGNSVFCNVYGEQARYYEGEKIPVMKHKKIGTLSMVSCGKNIFGSQFFITLGEDLDSLDDEHLIFGEVVEGFEILDKLNKTLTDENHRPYQDIRITHTVILHDPFPDPEELPDIPRSPSPSEAIIESNYITVYEDLDENVGKTMEEIEESTAMKEAEARATILEMVGDLPDAEVAPEENVLFICKLNPVTTSDDLEIIFNRFGKIKSCEIIYDKITKNSLQYGFIEFSNKKSCEDAYFKMDNVLIDDRRIHVDFNQSVSRLRWKGKGRIEYFDEKGRKTNDQRTFNPNEIIRRKDKNKKEYREKYGHRENRYNEGNVRQRYNYNRSPSPIRKSYHSYSSKYDKDSQRHSKDRNPENKRGSSDKKDERYRENKKDYYAYEDNRKYYKQSKKDKYVRPSSNERHYSEDSRRPSDRKMKSKKHKRTESDDSSDDSLDKRKQEKLMKKLKKELKKNKKKKKDKK